jgi:hypothetical protein
MLMLALGFYYLVRRIHPSRRTIPLLVAIWLSVATSSPQWLRAQIAFDVNATAPARSVEPYGLMSRLPGSRFVEVHLDTSALIPSSASRLVQETMVRVVSRHEEVLVADYSPRTEMQSEVFGTMQVSLDSERIREASLQGMAGYPGVGSASGYSNQTEVGHQTIHFAKKPSLELVTASGTIERHRGVFFKARRSSQLTLEGARQFRILLEVPENWRAELLDVSFDAIGLESVGAKRSIVLANQRFVVAVYQENDEVAARAAANYIKQQSNLIQAARSYARTIEHRNFPTPFHRLGAKLDIYEPEIPKGWFEALVYQPGMAYHISKLSPLPVDLRVTIMNYLDKKMWIESLCGVEEAASPYRIGSNAPLDIGDVARR